MTFVGCFGTAAVPCREIVSDDLSLPKCVLRLCLLAEVHFATQMRLMCDGSHYWSHGILLTVAFLLFQVLTLRIGAISTR